MGSTREFYKKLLARHLNGDVGREPEVRMDCESIVGKSVFASGSLFFEAEFS